MFGIVVAYLITIPIMIGFDATWIGFIMKGFYQSRLAPFLSGEINWYAAIILYIILAFGVFYFASYPAFLKHSLMSAVLNGLLVGFVVYAVYDLTNFATFAHYRSDFAFVDIGWGTFLSGLVAAIGYGLLSVLV